MRYGFGSMEELVHDGKEPLLRILRHGCSAFDEFTNRFNSLIASKGGEYRDKLALFILYLRLRRHPCVRSLLFPSCTSKKLRAVLGLGRAMQYVRPAKMFGLIKAQFAFHEFENMWLFRESLKIKKRISTFQ